MKVNEFDVIVVGGGHAGAEAVHAAAKLGVQAALVTIDAAARQVLERRAALGALESRINKTVDDLMLTIENLTASDSRIRDADFAVETSNLTQAQIVQEAGVAILAQANVIPRMALDLLKS